MPSVRRNANGYVGWVGSAALTQAPEATHWVIAPATHLYPRPDVKAQAEGGAVLRIGGERDSGTAGVSPASRRDISCRRQHLMPIAARFDDPVGVADLFLGTPYLWGGSSRWGGLTVPASCKLALAACGTDCPRDSDQQAEALGEDIDAHEPLKRGDLVFWKGHCGLMADAKMLLHANRASHVRRL